MINPFTHRRVLKHGTPGRATIVAASVPARGASMFNMAMTLQVFVEGRSPYEVEGQWMVKASDTEALSGSIPVKVDPDEPDKVAIDWDTSARGARRGDGAAAGRARRAGGRWRISTMWTVPPVRLARRRRPRRPRAQGQARGDPGLRAHARVDDHGGGERSGAAAADPAGRRRAPGVACRRAGTTRRRHRRRPENWSGGSNGSPRCTSRAH